MADSSTPPPTAGTAGPLQLADEAGARAQAHAHGAHVTSFVHGRFGETLFLSRHSRFGPGASIRGGVPVIFPQFAADGPLPRHGFVRTAEWAVVEQEDSRAVFRLQDSEETRAVWPYQWTAEVAVEVRNGALRMAFTVSNTGQFGFAFTGGLHTYLRLGDVRRCTITGLGGVRFRDRVTGAERASRDDVIRLRSETDRVYLGAPDRVTVRDGAARRALVVEKDGFADLVVWNPWAVAARALPDLGDEEYRDFVCVEPANVADPIYLDPRQRWTGRQTIRVEEAP